MSDANNTERYDQFILAEYHEACNAYFKGVDIGYTSVKGYVAINGVFAALIGALSDPKGPLPSGLAEVVKFVPWFALMITVCLIAALPHYYRHLNNCSARCEELERHFGGRLFTKLNAIADHGSAVKTLSMLLVVGSAIGGFWIYFGIKSFGIEPLNLLRSIPWWLK